MLEKQQKCQVTTMFLPFRTTLALHYVKQMYIKYYLRVIQSFRNKLDMKNDNLHVTR